jgi:hypothetical protein
MRKLAILGLLGILLSASLASSVVGTAAAGLPKPWQWKPARAEARLIAVDPIVARNVPSRLLWASCKGQGRGIAGSVSVRFSRFTCRVGYGRPEAPSSITLTVRVVPVGTGKICVVPGSEPVSIKPERACRSE